MLSSNSLVFCSFTLAKHSAIFFSLLIGYELIGYELIGYELIGYEVTTKRIWSLLVAVANLGIGHAVEIYNCLEQLRQL